MRAQRRHARTAANVNYFVLRRFDMEIAEWPNGSNDVPGFEALHESRAGAAITILPTGRRGDADIEFELVVLCGIGCEGIIAPQGDIITALVIKYMLRFPYVAVWFFYFDLAETDFAISGNFKLQIIAGLIFRERTGVHRFKREFLNIGRNIDIGYYAQPATFGHGGSGLVRG